MRDPNPPTEAEIQEQWDEVRRRMEALESSEQPAANRAERRSRRAKRG